MVARFGEPIARFGEPLGKARSGGGGVVNWGVPQQSLGGEALTNGTFAAWTLDNPDSWVVVGESGSDPQVTQTAPNGSAGTGAAKFFSSATASQPQITQEALTINTYYELDLTVSAYTGGTAQIDDTVAELLKYSAAQQRKTIARASDATFRLRSANATANWVADVVSAKPLTLNPQQAAPSANMRIEFFYTISVSPGAGEQVWVLPRISNFNSGNYWLALLEYTGTQWNITLYSVATHTRASRISATGIGATDGIAVMMNGDDISLYTTADAGDNWTQRGTTISNATYNTATGVNVLYSSTVTPGNLVYEPAA